MEAITKIRVNKRSKANDFIRMLRSANIEILSQLYMSLKLSCNVKNNEYRDLEYKNKRRKRC